MITQAIIAAGGLGTRLRPMTDTIPKPMLPIYGRPLLEWQIEQFKKHGVQEFFLTLCYLPDVIMDYFGDGSMFGVKINYFVEKEPLGSAGAIKKFEDQLDETFYYLYGDIFSLMDYTKMSEVYAKKENHIGMQRMGRTDSYDDADVAELGADGRVVAIHGKPHSSMYPNAYRMRGSFVLDKKILSYIPVDTTFDFGKQLLPKMIAAGEHFYAYECNEYSKGIDTMEKMQEVELYLQEHKIAPWW